MREYEVLSRASAFLLGVDKPEPEATGTGEAAAYAHLEASERKREARARRHERGYSPPTAAGGRMIDMGWLEFVPREARPAVHVVASSHVLSPFLWRDYYPQDWLSRVRQEHCRYSLEVFDPERPDDEALAKLAVNPEPYHHPEGRDIALIHFREEADSLNVLRRLGVDILHLRHSEKLYEKGEELSFHGFHLRERNAADSPELNVGDAKKKGEDPEYNEEEARVFHPHTEKGNLSFHADDRFFATTPEPLPEGSCGGPVLDNDGDLCGIVEGIVPVNHKNEKLAGSAAFLPSYAMAAFVDSVERALVKSMMPKDLFSMVVHAKKTNAIGGTIFRKDEQGNYTGESSWDEAYNEAVEGIKKRYTKEEQDAIWDTIEREGEEVMEIIAKEGGDLKEIVERVRLKTRYMQALAHHQYRKFQAEQEASSNTEEASSSSNSEATAQKS
jgi:hypothetical protein